MNQIPWQRPSKIGPAATDVVEVADTDDGVLLRIYPGDLAFLISRWAWADFLTAVNAGEYDTTLPGAEECLRLLGGA